MIYMNDNNIKHERIKVNMTGRTELHSSNFPSGINANTHRAEFH